jgi:N-acetylglucosaminyl-diphospho-decaprenol L-rhamnosyltransferase
VQPGQVSVVILTWNDGELMTRAVASAVGSEGLTPSVLVVDNGSSTPAAVETARVVRSDVNLGVAKGRNLGVAVTDTEFVCFLDSDAALMPDSLLRLREILEQQPNVALVAPVFVGQPPEASGGRAPTMLRKVHRILGRTSEYEAVARTGDVWDVDFAIGACQFFRRSAFDAVGGLEDKWFYGPEDADFCMRLRGAGWRVVQTSRTQATHVARRNRRAPLTWRGVKHARTVVAFHWRHRGYRRLPRATS